MLPAPRAIAPNQIRAMQSRITILQWVAEEGQETMEKSKEPLNKLVFEFSMGLSVDFEDMSVQPSD